MIVTMKPIKEYIAKLFLNNAYHFKCDCLVPLDVTGIVKDYEINNNEIVLIVEVYGKLLHIGLNTPSLTVAPL